MSRKCAICDSHYDLIYNGDEDDFYCSTCTEQKHHYENVCYCNEHYECLPCIRMEEANEIQN